MTTTPLPPFPRPSVYDPGRFGVAYSQAQMADFATAARADLEAENQRLREALTLTFSHLVEHIDRWDDELLECKKTVKAVTGKKL